jgi:8-oxo-dGTP pyrophosphatase MutT (NUDIX family)
MFTFPGGAYDDSDQSLKITAIRELFEETGVVLNINIPHDLKKTMSTTNRSLKEWRKLVQSNPTKYSEFLSSISSSFIESSNYSNLYHFCTFITPDFEPKKFTTLFYLTEFPSHKSHQLEADGYETDSLLWLTPHEALEQNSQGQMVFLPPQFYILSELISLSSNSSSFSTLDQLFSTLSISPCSVSHFPQQIEGLIDCRGYPALKPYPLATPSGSQSSMTLTLPYDECHPFHPPRQEGKKYHRIECRLPMGQGGYTLRKS